VTRRPAAFGGQQPAIGPGASLVTGTVAAGPISPLARVGQPSTRPVPEAAVEAVRGNDVVAATRTDNSGRYQLSLRPGTYLIRAQGGGSPYSRQPGQTVTISAGQTLTVDFVLDTGIR
jgi:Carboxypeptidase regulatory-like domain